MRVGVAVMVLNQHQITQEGLDKLIEELDELKNVRIAEIAIRIKEAKDFGDLSENAEFDEARKEQAMVAARIKKLEQIIENALVIDTSITSLKTVSVGLTVTLYDFEFDENIEYKLVGDPEANPLEGKLSSQSPVGAALIGKKKGETVEVHVPDGVVKYKIVKISK